MQTPRTILVHAPPRLMPAVVHLGGRTPSAMSSDEGDNADLHELPASIDAEDGIG